MFMKSMKRRGSGGKGNVTGVPGRNKAKSGSLLQSLGIELSRAKDDDEEEEVVVLHATCYEWQIGLAGAQSPETFADDEVWENALDRSKGTKIMEAFLSRRYSTEKPCAPNLLVVIEAEQLQHDGAMVHLRGMLEKETTPKKRRSSSSGKKSNEKEDNSMQNKQLAPALSGAKEWIEWARDDIGFFSVLIIDSRHAALFDHKQTSCCAANVTREDGASVLAVARGYAVAEVRVNWPVSKSTEDRIECFASAVAQLMKSLALDIRTELMSRIYVTGSRLESALGCGNPDALPPIALALDKQVTTDLELPSTSSNTCKVMFPAQRRYSSWLGASALCSLQMTKRAWTATEQQDSRFFDATAQLSATTVSQHQSYWASMLGAFDPSLESDLADAATSDQASTALPRNADPVDFEARRTELIKLNATKKTAAPSAHFLKEPLASGPLWLWGEPVALIPRPQDAPELPDLPTKDTQCKDIKKQDEEEMKHNKSRDNLLSDADAASPSPRTPGKSPLRRKTSLPLEANAKPLPEVKFSALQKQLRQADGDRNAQFDLVDHLASGHTFSCKNIQQLLEAVPEKKTKLGIIDRLGPRCSDPEHGSEIVNLFTYDEDKHIVSEVFASASRQKSLSKSFGGASGSRSTAIFRGSGRSGRGAGRGRGRGHAAIKRAATSPLPSPTAATVHTTPAKKEEAVAAVSNAKPIVPKDNDSKSTAQETTHPESAAEIATAPEPAVPSSGEKESETVFPATAKAEEKRVSSVHSHLAMIMHKKKPIPRQSSVKANKPEKVKPAPSNTRLSVHYEPKRSSALQTNPNAAAHITKKAMDQPKRKSLPVARRPTAPAALATSKEFTSSEAHETKKALSEGQHAPKRSANMTSNPLARRASSIKKKPTTTIPAGSKAKSSTAGPTHKVPSDKEKKGSSKSIAPPPSPLANAPQTPSKPPKQAAKSAPKFSTAKEVPKKEADVVDEPVTTAPMSTAAPSAPGERRVQFDKQISLPLIDDPAIAEIVEKQVAARLESELVAVDAAHQAEIASLQKRHVSTLYLIDRESLKMQQEYEHTRLRFEELANRLIEERKEHAKARATIRQLQSALSSLRADPDQIALAREFESCALATGFGELLQQM